MIMKFWIARHESGSLWLFDYVPSLHGEYWIPQIEGEAYVIDYHLFPEVTFENSPQEVELKLVE